VVSTVRDSDVNLEMQAKAFVHVLTRLFDDVAIAVRSMIVAKGGSLMALIYRSGACPLQFKYLSRRPEKLNSATKWELTAIMANCAKVENGHEHDQRA
jgi:hypothetical protein